MGWFLLSLSLCGTGVGEGRLAVEWTRFESDIGSFDFTSYTSSCIAITSLSSTKDSYKGRQAIIVQINPRLRLSPSFTQAFKDSVVRRDLSEKLGVRMELKD